MTSFRLRLSLLAAIVVAVCVTGSSAASAANSSLGQKAAAAALTELGAPYVWGQDTPSAGFDDSGLVVWAFAKAGLPNLPHYTAALWRLGRHVSRRQLRVGDLVFFDSAGHVGIYIGNGRFVHAPHLGLPVRVQALSSGLYSKNYVGAVRLTH